MTTIRTIADAIGYVERILDQNAGTDIEAINRISSNRLSITVKGADPKYSHITLEFGCPTFFMSDRSDARMDRVTVKAHRVERGRYGWSDRTRNFPVRKDNTLNGAGILRAIEQMAAQVLEAEQARKEQKTREDRKAEHNNATRVHLGLDKNYTSLKLDNGYGNVQIRDGGLVDISLKGLDQVDAKAILAMLKGFQTNG